MTARHYITDHGVPVFVEVSTDADRVEVERELRRVYGASFRLGRFVRRGKRQRANVEKVNDYEAVTRRVTEERRADGWLGGAP
jgi:hypothetical protein